MNLVVLGFSEKLQISDVVIVVIEVAMMNVVAFGNFAVKIRPNETVNACSAAEIPSFGLANSQVKCNGRENQTSQGDL